MVNSARRAKRRRLAQQAQRREGSRSAHQMDPADLSGPGTDQEGDEDQEIIFAPRVERVEGPPPAPETVQATTDCEIITMVKTLNGAIAAVSQDTARIRRAYDQLRAENIAMGQGPSGPLRHGKRVWFITGDHATSSGDTDRRVGRGR